MSKVLLVAAGLVVIGLLLLARGDTQSVQATHGNLNVHVHDDAAGVGDGFYHPAGAFGSPTDHAAAEAACMVADPAATCDAQIHVGDTITWVTAAPQAATTHTVTECTDNTFTVCGAAVAANNPIGDSGIRQPSPATPPTGWPYGPVTFTAAGTFYYSCAIHPDVMRGRVVVSQAPSPSPSPSPTASPTAAPSGSPTAAPATPASAPITGGVPGGDGASPWLILLIVGGTALLTSMAVLTLRSVRRT